MYDFLIVGAGLFGATFARIATDKGKSCLVIDRLPHVAGAAHDFRWNDTGQLVSSYGAHIFHTHSEDVWKFINQFSTIQPFINRPKVLSRSTVYSFPINLMTLHQMWGVVTPNEALKKIKEVRVPCEHPRNFEEWALSKIGRELYETFIYGYTKKQWMTEPSNLPSSIIQRLPIRLTYDENYFSAKYQGMPTEGYTKLVENILEGIAVRLGVDFFTLGDWTKYAKRLIFTGPIDKLFNYEFGKLDYNTLRFEHKAFKGDYQGNAVFNYADISVPYLRSVEHKHFKPNYLKHYSPYSEQTETIVSFDYPVAFSEHPEPYYPIRDDKNLALFQKYSSLLTDQSIIIGGRLGKYVYCDIDQTISSAMEKAKKICC